ncbi:MAG: LysR substrate-binding domain-containing protein [Pseudomonadales bacterium]
MKYNLPSLKALRAAETVGRHGSITGAASELHVTPGAISRHITLLEDYFGCKLFTRHATGLALTEVGRLYVDRLGEAFELIDQACSQILRVGERTTLVVRSLGTFSAEWLLPHISRFEHEYPDIEVSIRATLRGVDFDTDDADVGIIGSPDQPGDVESTKIYTPYVTPIMSPDLIRGSAPISSVADLEPFKLLHSMKLSPTWEEWVSQVAPDELLDTSRGHSLERSSQIYHAVRKGVGVGLGQFLLIGEDLISGSLVAPIPKLVPSPYSMYIVWPKRQKVRPEVRLFKEWLIAAIATTEQKLAQELPQFDLIDTDHK